MPLLPMQTRLLVQQTWAWHSLNMTNKLMISESMVTPTQYSTLLAFLRVDC